MLSETCRGILSKTRCGDLPACYSELVTPLPHSMPQFVTIKEAANLTGKSPSSIRRVIYPIIRDDKHPDRKHIEPSPAEALKLRMKGDNFPWRLSEDFLRREIPIEEQSEKGTPAKSARGSTTDERGELLAMLRRELDIKNHQITQQSELIKGQMELINGLGERLREGNILIGSLQQRFALPDGKERPKVEPIETKRDTVPPRPEKRSKPTPKPTKPKKNFLRRLFG